MQRRVAEPGGQLAQVAHRIAGDPAAGAGGAQLGQDAGERRPRLEVESARARAEPSRATEAGSVEAVAELGAGAEVPQPDGQDRVEGALLGSGHKGSALEFTAQLPADAKTYATVLLTRESDARPSRPGRIVVQGALCLP